MMSFRPRPALADSWYSLSYLYFCPVGIIVTMVTGLFVSAVSGKDDWLWCFCSWVKRWIINGDCFSLGGCKQKKDRPELFITKSDLLCFRFSGETEVRSFFASVMNIYRERRSLLSSPDYKTNRCVLNLTYDVSEHSKWYCLLTNNDLLSSLKSFFLQQLVCEIEKKYL